MSVQDPNDGHVRDEAELLALLRGELDRSRTQAVTAHLRECEQCAAELVDVVAVHAHLAAAARLLNAPRSRTDLPAREPIEPPSAAQLELPALA